MSALTPDEGDTANRVAKDFTRLYYHVLNNTPEYLHQFYGPSSSVTVSETQDDGTNLTIRADGLELIKGLTMQMFGNVKVTLTNWTPQTSLSGSVQLMVSGVMNQKNCDEERLFTQAMLLVTQDGGYYVLSDTVHVHSRDSSWKVLSFEEPTETDRVATPSKETEIKQEACQELPDTNEQTPPVAQDVEMPPEEVPEFVPEVESRFPQELDEETPPPQPPIEKPIAQGSVPKMSYRDVLKSPAGK